MITAGAGGVCNNACLPHRGKKSRSLNALEKETQRDFFFLFLFCITQAKKCKSHDKKNKTKETERTVALISKLEEEKYAFPQYMSNSMYFTNKMITSVILQLLSKTYFNLIKCM